MDRINIVPTKSNGHSHSPSIIPTLFPQPEPSVEEIPATSLEEKQSLLAHHVRLVTRRMSNGLFVAGAGGFGKSHTISNTLVEEGICPVLINSHITPLSLYQALYFNRTGEIIWLDDCDSIYSNLVILGILRSALWGQGQRIVTYTSSQLPDNLPARFVFDSRIVFCANTIPKRNDAFKALLSRVDVFRLDATNEEIIEEMRFLADRGNGTLTAEECHSVIDFIEKASSNRRLSMRLYEPSLRKCEYAKTAGVDWQDLVRCQLEQLNHDENVPKSVPNEIECLKQAMEKFPSSVKQQEAFWRKATGKSRASFYRLKKKCVE